MKLSKEQTDFIQHSCLDESTKFIEYLEIQKSEQQKRDNLNLFFTILNTLLAISALIASIFALL